MNSGSVQWFFDQLVANRIIVINGSTYWDKVKAKHEMLLEQAKAMHKEEIGRAYHEGLIDGMNCTPKDYYNETFGGNK